MAGNVLRTVVGDARPSLTLVRHITKRKTPILTNFWAMKWVNTV